MAKFWSIYTNWEHVEEKSDNKDCKPDQWYRLVLRLAPLKVNKKIMLDKFNIIAGDPQKQTIGY